MRGRRIVDTPATGRPTPLPHPRMHTRYASKEPGTWAHAPLVQEVVDPIPRGCLRYRWICCTRDPFVPSTFTWCACAFFPRPIVRRCSTQHIHPSKPLSLLVRMGGCSGPIRPNEGSGRVSTTQAVGEQDASPPKGQASKDVHVGERPKQSILPTPHRPRPIHASRW